MAARVVMLREIPRRRSTRTMWLMWSHFGYSCRPCPDPTRDRSRIAVEFWIVAPTASADTLASYEWELDDALASRKVKAASTGGGSLARAVTDVRRQARRRGLLRHGFLDARGYA